MGWNSGTRFDLPEAKLASVVSQAILPALAFLVVNHLSRR